MNNTTTTIQGNTVSIEYDHHYNNIYCVDIYVNSSFKRQDNISSEVKKAILIWIDSQFKLAISQGNVLCLSVYTADGHGTHRTAMFERLGFSYGTSGPLMYQG
jgi:hypothetical protein